jgi:phenolic acid decarboxylase
MRKKSEYDQYTAYIIGEIAKMGSRKTQEQLDEEVLDKMDLKNIENYLRKKKLKNISR